MGGNFSVNAISGVVAGVLNSITPFMFLPHLSMIALLASNEKQRLILGGI